MIGIMMIYFAAGIYDIFNLCIVVYAATMLYVMIFVLDGLEFTPLTVSRILLHFITLWLQILEAQEMEK